MDAHAVVVVAGLGSVVDADVDADTDAELGDVTCAGVTKCLSLIMILCPILPSLLATL